MSAQQRVDFAHTPRAEASRRRKARALANAAIELGLTDDDLMLGAGGRAPVLAAAGIEKASEDTWFVVHQILTAHRGQTP